MNKKNAIILLIVFGNLSVIVIGSAQCFLLPLIRYTLPFMLAAAAVLIAHTLAAKFSRRGMERRYGISARRYILCGTLPALILSLLVNILSFIFLKYDIGALSGMGIDGLPAEWIFSLFATGYSVAFLAAQAVAVAREIW
ncbi:MAG: hypothetical protein K2N38_10145 [Oscillospiraceae bacterium]|nr:hypothetical protein [Oscillospiraceae bacterium]